MLRRLLASLRTDLPPVPLAGRLDPAAIAIPMVASVCLVVSFYHGSPPQWAQVALFLPRVELPYSLCSYLFWFAASVALYLVAPFGALLLLREPLREYGLGPGRWRLGLAICVLFLAVMIPVAIIAARFPAFANHYPRVRDARQSFGLLALYELGQASYLVAWEYLFRGFLLIGLYRRIGLHAIYVTTMPFVMLHLGKPEPEALASVFAGVALGYMALKTRSFWWGTLLHIGTIATMDIASSWSHLGRG